MEPALTVNKITKSYENGTRALRGLSFKVENGDFYALLGPNGAGKSTLIGIITSLVNKTRGEVKVFGYDTDLHPAESKSRLGLVPQEVNFSIFETPMQILINQAGYYGIPRSLANAKSEEYLHTLGLWEQRNTIGRNLSGGMKRRLLIARALVHHPQLLILDEPTAGVDIEIRRSMWSFLREINAAGTTIILTTHYLEEAEHLCRNIGIIDHGKLIHNTSMKSLLMKLGNETFILDLDQPLTALPSIDHYPLRQIDSTTLEVDVDRKRGLNPLFAALLAHSINVTSLRNKANRLEELFIKIVSENSDGMGSNP
ncbi:MAG: ABC transporter ATP-binding protein [Arenicellales bacterium]|jgi:ABC-2 type transport system ATP-binding protein|nr:ABC transporter [Acidiferrobacteraceae bacterium]MDP6122990.1 ABC transporter ATP-binding protein [Arenicellales bacterium]MDP6434000.1 ABC transporter ATP-binding protein [Arenicellales bacterium]MDP6671961.1 ABC transporter ATP-binding protein [Arenicellales bacterium]MDP6723876.1 ABC transporter ATP-binding protein [Arenicellales bacterium]|tara:strand:- start:970 stop:1908 length:939 start_codon:yes stop_codon:yes gene_type:complete